MAEILFPDFEFRACDVVLDVGCGTGDACYLAGRAGAAVIALDTLPATVRHVDNRMRDVPARSYQSFVSDGNPIPLADNSCTKIVAREVLEHVRNPERLLREMVRVGAKGAHYLIGVPDAASENLLAIVAPQECWEEPNHIHVFGRDKMRTLLDAAGLKIERTVFWGFYWSIWWMFQFAVDENARMRAAEGANGESASPLMKAWEETWRQFELLGISQHGRLVEALDGIIPKSQVYVCLKE